MNINADCHCIIGSLHDNCEDYALVDVNDMFAYALISDGCSSSKNTDIGARIVVHSARQIIANEIGFSFRMDSELKWNDESRLAQLYDYIGNEIIKKSDLIRRSMDLPIECLDASLIIAIRLADSNKTIVFAYGDGNIIAKSKDSYSLISTVYQYNAPKYLSYNTSEFRMNIFSESVKNGNTKRYYINHNGKLEVRDGEPVDRSIFIFEDLDYIAICSDGIDSFVDSQMQAVGSYDISLKFTAFKNYNGEFVKRRLKALERECIKSKTVHNDDISMAVIYSKE